MFHVTQIAQFIDLSILEISIIPKTFLSRVIGFWSGGQEYFCISGGEDYESASS